MGVDHFDVHLQVVFELAGRLDPCLSIDPRAGHALQFTTEVFRQAALAEGELAQGRADEVRHRHEVLAQRLGQAAHQVDGLGLDQPRHQPLQALARQLWQQRRGHP